MCRPSVHHCQTCERWTFASSTSHPPESQDTFPRPTFLPCELGSAARFTIKNFTQCPIYNPLEVVQVIDNCYYCRLESGESESPTSNHAEVGNVDISWTTGGLLGHINRGCEEGLDTSASDDSGGGSIGSNPLKQVCRLDSRPARQQTSPEAEMTFFARFEEYQGRKRTLSRAPEESEVSSSTDKDGASDTHWTIEVLLDHTNQVYEEGSSTLTGRCISPEQLRQLEGAIWQADTPQTEGWS